SQTPSIACRLDSVSTTRMISYSAQSSYVRTARLRALELSDQRGARTLDTVFRSGLFAPALRSSVLLTIASRRSSAIQGSLPVVEP
ncbi:hypothetical protein PENTCL1PPCAC_28221, partial [Pristionchus entomophagus]